jgi:hypothetical protein
MLFSLKGGLLKDASLLPARQRFEPPRERPGLLRALFTGVRRRILRTSPLRSSQKFVASVFLGAWKVADVPGVDLSRSVRATLHEHSHLLSERVLADRGLDLSDSCHRLIVYLKEALSALDPGDY